jgi:exonuclease VII small subunit
MKSKNIPVDIKSKTAKEAQIEIKELISSLENSEKSLQDSISKYNRMIHLNNHIQEKFRERSKEISNSKKNKKNL